MSLGVRVTYLPVGQGTANMVEVYDYNLDARTETLVQLYLIDCGGDSPSHHAHASNSENIILNAMALRAASIPGNPCTHYLDVLTISHQDKDHYSIFNNILRDNSSGNLKIGKYYRFDQTPCFTLSPQERYTSASFEEFNTRAVSNATDSYYFSSPPNFAMNADNDYLPFFNYPEDEPDVFLTALYSNGGAPAGAALGIRRNTLSLYIVLSVQLSHGDIKAFHFPGDATGYTMEAITNALATKNITLFATIMAAPHHGSFISIEGSKTPSEILDSFFKKIISEWHIISAGAFSRFGHPHLSYMNTLYRNINTSFIQQSVHYNTIDGSGSNFSNKNNHYKALTLCSYATLATPIMPAITKMIIVSYSFFEDGKSFFIPSLKILPFPSFVSTYLFHSISLQKSIGRPTAMPEDDIPSEL